MAVDPSGKLYGCHRESKSLIGHLDTGVDEELRAKWKDSGGLSFYPGEAWGNSRRPRRIDYS